MSRRAAIVVHVLALLTIAVSLVVIAGQDDRAAAIYASALIGFVAGIAFDHWCLRPLVDWADSRSRRGE